MDNNQWPFKAPPTKIQEKIRKGRPNKQWIDNTKEDLEPRIINITEAERQFRQAKEGKHWKHFLSSYCRN